NVLHRHSDFPGEVGECLTQFAHGAVGINGQRWTLPDDARVTGAQRLLSTRSSYSPAGFQDDLASLVAFKLLHGNVNLGPDFATLPGGEYYSVGREERLAPSTRWSPLSSRSAH